jgi:hypothetical protein
LKDPGRTRFVHRLPRPPQAASTVFQNKKSWVHLRVGIKFERLLIRDLLRDLARLASPIRPRLPRDLNRSYRVFKTGHHKNQNAPPLRCSSK